MVGNAVQQEHTRAFKPAHLPRPATREPGNCRRWASAAVRECTRLNVVASDVLANALESGRKQ